MADSVPTTAPQATERAPEPGAGAGHGSDAARPPAVAEVFERLRGAFDAGRTRPLAWRVEQLRGIERLVDECEADLVGAMAEDFGKPAVEAWFTDLAMVRTEASHARRNLHRWMRPRRVWPGRLNVPGRAFTVAEPRGVVLVVSPWNYPVQLALAPLVAALAAGNAAVVKPSELTPATSAVLARLLPRYVDPEAVCVVEGAVDTATALLELPFDHIFFTGSTTVGRVVMAAAARHLASVTLELGGKSPVVVARDAELAVTARRVAWGKLLNAGQTCIAPDYVLVERSVADELVDALCRSMADLQGPDPALTRTRIVNERHLARLESLLHSAGGTVVAGGKVDHAQRWIEPTVIVDPDPQAPIMQDEIFGPILPVVRVDSVDEALRFVRARPKPLALYLFTRSASVERMVVEQTSSGGVCINHVMMHFAVPELPFGGVGPSGLGAYHGRAGFEELSHRKPVLRRGFWPDLSIAYPPFDARKERILRRVL